MSVRIEHREDVNWFITFTCYNWLHLFEVANSYNLVYNWFNYLKSSNKAEVLAFVIMPNHVHAIIHLNSFDTDLNKLVSNGKRFIAYDLIRRLEERKETMVLNKLSEGVNAADRKKGQQHRVFEPSFDAKAVHSNYFLQQKLSYIHKNPVSGKWRLVDDYADYEHSSASFYEFGIVKKFQPKNYMDVWVI